MTVERMVAQKEHQLAGLLVVESAAKMALNLVAQSADKKADWLAEN